MQKDYRMDFLRGVEEKLSGKFDSEVIADIVDSVSMVLRDYEITERCTDIVPSEDINQRIMKRYFACLLVDGKSEKTIKAYKGYLSNAFSAVRKPITEIGAYDIRFYLAIKKEQGVSNRSLENIRAALSAFFQWLTVEEVIPKNPMLTLKPIKYKDEVRLPFSDVDIDALRSKCKNSKERAIMEILLSSGVRVSELCSMNVSDIDFQTLAVHVREGKGNKERVTYITSLALNHLKKYLSERKQGPEGFLFFNHLGGRINSSGVSFILKDIGKKAKVDNVHPHRFRRTFATRLANRGMDVQEIQRLLGHSNLTTTMEYVCVDDNKVKASYDKYIA